MRCKDKRNLRVITFQAEAGRAYTLVKYFAVFTDNDRVDRPLAQAAVEAVRQARALGYEQCLARHDEKWAEKWERCDVKSTATTRRSSRCGTASFNC